MSARLRLGLGLAAVLLLLAAGGWYWQYRAVGRFLQSTNDAVIQADQVTISAKLSGTVVAVPVEDNQVVAQGAALGEIDEADYRSRFSAAQAEVGTARAAIDVASAAEREAQAGIAAARAALDAALAGQAYADREVERFRPLVGSGAEPATRLSELVADRDRAAAGVASAEAGLRQATSKAASSAAQSAAQAAQLNAAEVSLASARIDLGRTRILAPIAGRIANRSIRAGQYVQPGARLMTIVPTGAIYVVANFKETQIGLMRPGQPATIHVDALPGITFRGVVSSVTPGTGANFSLIPPQNATGNFTKIVQRVPVRIRIEAGPEARQVLVPGLSLLVEVDTRAAASTMDAIRREQEHATP